MSDTWTPIPSKPVTRPQSRLTLSCYSEGSLYLSIGARHALGQTALVRVETNGTRFRIAAGTEGEDGTLILLPSGRISGHITYRLMELTPGSEYPLIYENGWLIGQKDGPREAR